MKRILIITGFLLATISILAVANNGYLQIMEESIAKMYAFESLESYKTVANQFEVIGKKEKDEWLPYYYHANCNIILVYADTEADFEQKQKYIAKASSSINKILESNPEESELHVLNAFLSVTKMYLSPEAAAQEIPYYTTAVNSAIRLEPSNPRAQYFQLSSKIGEAQFFGTDTKQFCPSLKKLHQSWDDYQIKSSIHPSWGKDEVLKKMKECGCQ